MRGYKEDLGSLAALSDAVIIPIPVIAVNEFGGATTLQQAMPMALDENLAITGISYLKKVAGERVAEMLVGNVLSHIDSIPVDKSTSIGSIFSRVALGQQHFECSFSRPGVDSTKVANEVTKSTEMDGSMDSSSESSESDDGSSSEEEEGDCSDSD